MRDRRRLSSVDRMSHPQSYEILLLPEPEESAVGAPAPGTAVRSAVVAATGQTGASGYPRYAGGGIEADIDPATRTVEALLVDGAELDYGLTVRIAERIGSMQGTPTGEPEEAVERPPGGERGGREAQPDAGGTSRSGSTAVAPERSPEG